MIVVRLLGFIRCADCAIILAKLYILCYNVSRFEPGIAIISYAFQQALKSFTTKSGFTGTISNASPELKAFLRTLSKIKATKTALFSKTLSSILIMESYRFR